MTPATRARCPDGSARAAEKALGTVLGEYILGLEAGSGMAMDTDMADPTYSTVAWTRAAQVHTLQGVVLIDDL